MRGRQTGWSIAFPPGNRAALPVLVVLHGRSANHRDAFGASLHLDRYLARAVRGGAAPFAIASVGGDHSYWHPRRDSDAAGMVVDEFLPLLGRHGLDVSRIGLLGWSMGGYGALYLASVLRHRVAVAVAESPALWHTAAQSAAGAFDDADDFEAHSIWRRLDRLHGIPLRVDCGSSDGFAPVTRDLRAALTPTPAGGLEPGGHDAAYWRSQAPAQLAFVATYLG
jgi:S-formylglutathione hydrolase FrmB